VPQDPVEVVHSALKSRGAKHLILNPGFQNKDLSEVLQLIDSRIAKEIFWKKRHDLIHCVLGAGNFRFLPKDIRNNIFRELFFYVTVPGLQPRPNEFPVRGDIAFGQQYWDAAIQWIDWIQQNSAISLISDRIKILLLTLDRDNYGYYNSSNIHISNDTTSFKLPTRTQCRDWIVNATMHQSTTFYLNGVKYIVFNRLELREESSDNILHVICGLNTQSKEKTIGHQIALVAVQSCHRIDCYQVDLPSDVLRDLW